MNPLFALVFVAVLSLSACDSGDSAQDGSPGGGTVDQTPTPGTEPATPEPTLDDLELTLTYPIDLELTESDQLLVQWRSTEDALVHEYRIALLDRDDASADLGYYSVRSTGVDGIQTYSQNWLGAAIEPGKRYAVDVWAHDREGTALRRSDRQYFHVVYANGCYRNVEHDTTYVAREDGDAYLLDGCITFDTPPQPQLLAEEPGFIQQGTWRAVFDETRFGPLEGAFGPEPASCARYLEVWPMNENAMTLNVTTQFNTPNSPSTFWGFRLPQVAPGTPLYLDVSTCATRWWTVDRYLQVFEGDEDDCLGCDGGLSEIRPIDVLPPDTTPITHQNFSQ